MTATLTAATVARDHLHPALDAIAHNLHQARLIHNEDTPEIDSIVEHAVAIARNLPADERYHITALLQLVRELAESNAAEGECIRQIAGAADQTIVDMRRIERRVAEPAEWNTRKTVVALRDPLAVLNNPIITGQPRVEALGRIAGLIDEIPRDVLTSMTVRHNLGVKAFSLLLALIDGTQAVAA